MEKSNIFTCEIIQTIELPNKIRITSTNEIILKEQLNYLHNRSFYDTEYFEKYKPMNRNWIEKQLDNEVVYKNITNASTVEYLIVPYSSCPYNIRCIF